MRPISRRHVAVAVCLLALVARLVAYGTLTPDPAADRFPGNVAVVAVTAAVTVRVAAYRCRTARRRS